MPEITKLGEDRLVECPMKNAIITIPVRLYKFNSSLTHCPNGNSSQHTTSNDMSWCMDVHFLWAFIKGCRIFF
jgi:hypothetical protein